MTARRPKKRGGGRLRFSIDAAEGEQRYRFEPADDWTPDRLYERRWALTLLDDVMQRLAAEYDAKNKSDLFTRCRIHLAGGAGPDYAAIAAELATTPAALRVAVHRLRQRYRELLQDAVAQTIGPGESIEDEITRLRAAIRGR